MPLAAARSRERTASTPAASVSEAEEAEEEDDGVASPRRALTINVFTSDRTPRLRADRRTPARACFFADAVRLAT
jgi:hypothetical protein